MDTAGSLDIPDVRARSSTIPPRGPFIVQTFKGQTFGHRASRRKRRDVVHTGSRLCPVRSTFDRARALSETLSLLSVRAHTPGGAVRRRLRARARTRGQTGKSMLQNSKHCRAGDWTEVQSLRGNLLLLSSCGYVAHVPLAQYRARRTEEVAGYIYGRRSGIRIRGETPRPRRRPRQGKSGYT